MLLQPFDPGRRVLADAQGLGAERPGLDDRVLGLEVEVAHRAEGPVDAERARLGCRNDAGGPRRLEVVQQPERRRGRQLGHARHLLGDAALQVGADEERPAGPLAEVARERADAGRGAAEDDEAADAGREGGVDLGALVVEAAAAPAQGGEHEPGERRRHAGVTEPSTRGPRAPVAAGRLPGFPASVRKPRNAKASASLASPSKKSWANGTTGRGRTRSWSYGASGSTRRVTASITATPGPVSKATAPAITPRRGTQVTFAIPPRLRSSRPRSGCPNSITSASGTRGAPCPPAATSRERKSLTTRTPTRSAITAGSPSCSVARPGSCQIVWPCEATNDTSPGTVPLPARSCRMAPAKRSPSATWSSARSFEPPRAIASTICPRSAAPYGSWRNATSWAPSGSSVRRTSAVETPSSDVPDITPTARQLVTASVRAAGRRPPAARIRPPARAAARPRPCPRAASPSQWRASRFPRRLRSRGVPPAGLRRRPP